MTIEVPLILKFGGINTESQSPIVFLRDVKEVKDKLCSDNITFIINPKTRYTTMYRIAVPKKYISPMGYTL